MTKSGKLVVLIILGSVIVFLGWDIAQRFQTLHALPPAATSDISLPLAAENKQKHAMSRPEYKAIVERNIFGATARNQDQKGSEEIELLKPTSLKVSLYGTVVGLRNDSRAVIYDQATRKQQIYQEGDSVKNAVVKRILRGRVVLSVGGDDQVLAMPEQEQREPERSAPTRKTPAWADKRGGIGAGGKGPARTGFKERPQAKTMNSDVRLNGSVLKEVLDRINQESVGVRFLPHRVDGRTVGVAVEQKKPGFLLPRLGLRPGDIIVSADGRDLSLGEEVFSYYRNLEDGGSGAIIVLRQKKRHTINYNIR